MGQQLVQFGGGVWGWQQQQALALQGQGPGGGGSCRRHGGDSGDQAHLQGWMALLQGEQHIAGTGKQGHIAFAEQHHPPPCGPFGGDAISG